VAEVNFGGEMVERCINIEDRAVPVEIVHAARGKDARAEVAVARYRKGLVKHVGASMRALEREQTTWVPGQSDWSPNRLDSAVWLLHYLFEGSEPMNSGNF
jgi:phage terminase large subunit-like protein